MVEPKEETSDRVIRIFPSTYKLIKQLARERHTTMAWVIAEKFSSKQK